MNFDSFFQHNPPSGQQDAFKEFEATELYCPNCKRAVPVRQRLLLALPDGDEYEYLCAFCSTSVGTKIVRNTKPFHIITG